MWNIRIHTHVTTITQKHGNVLNREISHYYYTEFLPFVATLVFEQNINFKKANNYGKVICSYRVFNKACNFITIFDFYLITIF